ncbi:unnamed protein product, partial [Sphacelaria rigidula]
MLDLYRMPHLRGGRGFLSAGSSRSILITEGNFLSHFLPFQLLDIVAFNTRSSRIRSQYNSLSFRTIFSLNFPRPSLRPPPNSFGIDRCSTCNTHISVSQDTKPVPKGFRKQLP